MPEEKPQPVQRAQINLPSDPLTRLLADPNRPAFYANGFSVGTTATECFIIFTQNNVPKVAITLPFPSVLSLQKACEQAIKNYESQLNVKIRPAEELGKAIAEANKKESIVMSEANILVHNALDIPSRINDLTSLKDGWDFGSGHAPSKEVIENACYIFNHFQRPEYNYEVSPTSIGGVKITANIGKDFLDLTINPNLTIGLTHEYGFGVNYETIYQKDEVSMDEIELYLDSLSIQSCFLSGRYTLENTVNLKVVSTAIPLGTSMVVYPYLIMHAL